LNKDKAMAKSFKSLVPLRFRESDPAGIMFFGQIFAWAHDAFEDFIVEAGLPWEQYFENKSYLIPIRHTEADYFAPFRPGRKYEGTTTVQALGNSSFTMKYVFSSGSQKHAEVKMVHVCLDQQSHKPTPMPDKL